MRPVSQNRKHVDEEKSVNALTSLSSIVIGHPVPILAYRSSQKAIQNVLRLSSRSVQSFGGGRHCFTSNPTPSSLLRPIICANRTPFPVLTQARGKYNILNS